MRHGIVGLNEGHDFRARRPTGPGVVPCLRFQRSRSYRIRTIRKLTSPNAARVEHAIATACPDLVLNATAYNMVDVAEREPEAAFAGNALAVRSLALACRQADARFVHFSTDYVFDGTLGRPYIEEDATHPVGAYGVSKLAGEFYAQAYLDNALIIRTSGVFGRAGWERRAVISWKRCCGLQLRDNPSAWWKTSWRHQPTLRNSRFVRPSW